ncbi:hypothetical protein J6590_046756 [Homalodisca vitripennis]|nr:hypothetical protein J6590_046756 [Homalodisca vitripennis]
MIASIRCLEEENKTFVKEIIRSNIAVSNNYEVLEDLSEVVKMISSSEWKRRRKKKTRKPKLHHTTFNDQQKINTGHKIESKKPPHSTSTVPVAFRAVTIEGDSHACFMAGMVQSLVTARTAVLGVCKSGARLLGVVEGSHPPLGSCNVLIAGANDIRAGRS